MACLGQGLDPVFLLVSRAASLLLELKKRDAALNVREHEIRKPWR